ncbi:hypothetical protein B0I35DRAFT_8166 [Stachybotrys elegans]|uniref:Uncharacterized protein n=1 Tax=Stachybotrys elegans TaxID=80388 RepID=A0A8K0T1C9_9HYPO|nr:hypothetical protein B0I35DRAFT_8166 [Stachybotrys elegans]
MLTQNTIMSGEVDHRHIESSGPTPPACKSSLPLVCRREASALAMTCGSAHAAAEHPQDLPASPEARYSISRGIGILTASAIHHAGQTPCNPASIIPAARTDGRPKQHQTRQAREMTASPAFMDRQHRFSSKFLPRVQMVGTAEFSFWKNGRRQEASSVSHSQLCGLEGQAQRAFLDVIHCCTSSSAPDNILAISCYGWRWRVDTKSAVDLPKGSHECIQRT